MAKNMENTSYRKLDVDAYDPEKFEDNEDAETQAVGPDERQVSQLLQSMRLQDALKAALANPPLKTKNQAVKDRATALVTRVLTSFKTSDVENAIQGLDDGEVDLLMKYVYKAMDIQADNATCQYLLSWHAQLLARGGYGSIIRVFCDRQRL
ncbi:Actin-related protein 2/3 complex subunit 5 [Toxocara canis]|uniref:Actin-related protein 2/3 complex subunit 5 n=1 Tax=Toxocara canis TaxID=6265 RepID=A0A0B2VNN4_TOXCA|nr:Actin-related protein 2/3 complex subunit 5 [Toxocara canis]